MATSQSPVHSQPSLEPLKTLLSSSHGFGSRLRFVHRDTRSKPCGLALSDLPTGRLSDKRLRSEAAAAAASQRSSLRAARDLCSLLPALSISRSSLALATAAPALPSSRGSSVRRGRYRRAGCWILQAPLGTKRAGGSNQGLFFLLLQQRRSQKGDFSAGQDLTQALRASSASPLRADNEDPLSQVVSVQPALPSSSAFCRENGYKMLV